MNKDTTEIESRFAYWTVMSQGQSIHESRHFLQFFDGDHRFLRATKQTEGLTYRQLFDLVEAAQNYASASDRNSTEEINALLATTVRVFGEQGPSKKVRTECTCPQWAVLHPSNRHVVSCPRALRDGTDLEG